jgi:hypothetical protein
MMFILSDAGFKILHVFTDAPRWGSLLFFYCWPVLCLTTLYFVCLREKNALQRQENLRLFKFMVSPALMFGRIMMIAARAV